MVTWEELEQAITDGWRASLGVNKLGTWALVLGGASLDLSLFATAQCSIMWMFLISCFLLFKCFFSVLGKTMLPCNLHMCRHS